MCECVDTTGGNPGPGPDCGEPICINTVTTDDAPVVIPIGTTDADGEAISFRLMLVGIGSTAREGLFFEPHGNGASNSTGNGVGTPILVGTTGFVDPVLAPWTTIAVPAGWAASVAYVGDVLELSFNGAVGDTVHWRGQLDRWAHNGATFL